MGTVKCLLTDVKLKRGCFLEGLKPASVSSTGTNADRLMIGTDLQMAQSTDQDKVCGFLVFLGNIYLKNPKRSSTGLNFLYYHF